MIYLAKDLQKGMRIELFSNSYKVVQTVLVSDDSSATIYFTNGSCYHCFPNEEIVTISVSESIKRCIKEYS